MTNSHLQNLLTGSVVHRNCHVDARNGYVAHHAIAIDIQNIPVVFRGDGVVVFIQRRFGKAVVLSQSLVICLCLSAQILHAGLLHTADGVIVGRNRHAGIFLREIFTHRRIHIMCTGLRKITMNALSVATRLYRFTAA